VLKEGRSSHESTVEQSGIKSGEGGYLPAKLFRVKK
jgi:hypothetical protein